MPRVQQSTTPRTAQDRASLLFQGILAVLSAICLESSGRTNAYLGLRSAYAHVYKNAYDTDDMPSIEANMKLARDAAQKALFLDLGSEKARHAVDDLERRLAKLQPDG
jgi:hypothetical protein